MIEKRSGRKSLEKLDSLRCALGRLAAVLVLATSSPAIAGPTCPALRWTTLGTAGGPVPTVDRSEPANLLEADDQQVLVDTGDGTVTQLGRAGLSLVGVRTVFISHHHMDHTGGLAAVIGLRWMNQFPGELTVYGPPGTREIVDGIVRTMAPQARVGFGLGAADRNPAASVKVVEMRGDDSAVLGSLKVTAAVNSHFDHDGRPDQSGAISLSYRFTLGSRSVTYTGDTGPSPAVARLAQGSDMLVSEVIDLDRLINEIRQRRTDAPTQMLEQMRRHLAAHHLTAADAGAIASAAGVGRLVFTHFAVPGLLADAAPGLRAGAASTFAGTVELARDLSAYEIGCKG